MQSASGGRFCDHCTKVVRDFRQSSPEEIYDAFQQANGNVCGRFYSHQLAPAPSATSSPIRESLIRFALALWICFAPLFGTAQNKGGNQLLSKDGLPIAEKYSGKHSLLEIEIGSAIQGGPDENLTNDTVLLEGTETPTDNYQWTPAAVDTQLAILNPESKWITYIMGDINYTGSIQWQKCPEEWEIQGYTTMAPAPIQYDSTASIPPKNKTRRASNLPHKSPENPAPYNSAFILPPGRKEEEDENSPPAE